MKCWTVLAMKCASCQEESKGRFVITNPTWSDAPCIAVTIFACPGATLLLSLCLRIILCVSPSIRPTQQLRSSNALLTSTHLPLQYVTHCVYQKFFLFGKIVDDAAPVSLFALNRDVLIRFSSSSPMFFCESVSFRPLQRPGPRFKRRELSHVRHIVRTAFFPSPSLTTNSERNQTESLKSRFWRSYVRIKS